MANRTKFTSQARAKFLAVLSKGGSITAAAAKAGMSRRGCYDWRDNDAAFAQAWEDAYEEGSDRLEDEAMRRARDGTLKPVYQQGKMVGKVREYSDHLMNTMLKARRPERFKERVAAEHTGKGGGPIQTMDLTKLNDEQLDRLADLVGAATGAGANPGGEGSARG